MSDQKSEIRIVDGRLVLFDPQAEAVVLAVSKHNCNHTRYLNSNAIDHFKIRLSQRSETSADAVIVIINVDDVHGGPIADKLMPGANWQGFRDLGQVPFARGLASRPFIQAALAHFDTQAAEKLQSMTDVAVVVIDHGAAEVYLA